MGEGAEREGGGVIWLADGGGREVLERSVFRCWMRTHPVGLLRWFVKLQKGSKDKGVSKWIGIYD